MFEYTDLQVEVEAGIGKAGTDYRFGEVSIRANLMIPQAAEPARALELLHKAKGLCLVSRALSIQQTFEPVVTVAVPHALSPR